mmetsp:Transcript_11620/g.23621  ORF Transcript_11620/g.23621 Transcript_11620/m.23621 type:complete len:313 (+) Transcript_11620:326-1264(+)
MSHLFCLGSPLAQFLNIDDSLRYTLIPEKLPFRLYNIFHPNDPIAMRIEPFLESNYAGVPPVTIPHWWTMSRRKSTVRWLGTILSRKGKDEKRESDPLQSRGPAEPPNEDMDDQDDVSPIFAPSGIPINRIDFALQVSSTIEEMSTAYSALKAHADYWQSRDLMLFIVSNLLKLKLNSDRWAPKREKKSGPITRSDQSLVDGSPLWLNSEAHVESITSQVEPSLPTPQEGDAVHDTTLEALAPASTPESKEEQAQSIVADDVQIAATSVVDELIEFAAHQASLDIAQEKGRFLIRPTELFFSFFLFLFLVGL